MMPSIGFEAKVLALLQDLSECMADVEQRLNAIESKLDPPKPEVLTTDDAARHFGVHKNTLIIWRRKLNWVEGCHWWKHSNVVYYNIPLITDGQINGFTSATHLRAVQQFRQSLPSQRKKKK